MLPRFSVLQSTLSCSAPVILTQSHYTEMTPINCWTASETLLTFSATKRPPLQTSDGRCREPSRRTVATADAFTCFDTNVPTHRQARCLPALFSSYMIPSKHVSLPPLPLFLPIQTAQCLPLPYCRHLVFNSFQPTFVKSLDVQTIAFLIEETSECDTAESHAALFDLYSGSVSHTIRYLE